MSSDYLFLDFEANRETIKGKNLANSVGLEDQLHIYGINDYEMFILSLCHDDLTVFFSLPNFNNKIVKTDFGDYYNNCAIRIEQKDKDLVLLGDILEQKKTYENTVTVKRTYRVKSILFMDKTLKHYGELEYTVSPVIKVFKQWHDVRGNTYEWMDDQLNKKNVISAILINKLSRSTVVPNKEEVLTMFRDWEDYLDCHEVMINIDSERGYELSDKPKFFIAYSNNKNRCTSNEERTILEEGNDRIKFLDTRDYIYTKSRFNNDSEEKILCHIMIDVPLSEYLKQKNKRNIPAFKAKLDQFTKNPCLLSLPGFNNKDSKVKPLVHLHDSRISISKEQEIEPFQEYEKINEKHKLRVSDIIERADREQKNEINRKLSEYKTNELPATLSAFRLDNEQPTINRTKLKHQKLVSDAKEETDAEINSLTEEKSDLQRQINKILKSSNTDSRVKNKKHSSSDNTYAQTEKLRQRLTDCDQKIADLTIRKEHLDDEYDLDEMIDSELDSIVKEESERLIEEKRTEIEESVIPKFEKKRNTEVFISESEAKSERDEAHRNLTKMRLHTYFEIPVEGVSDIQNELKKLNTWNRDGIMLFKDTTGDRTILRRQKEALENLKNGDVVNPYLITALFSPESTGTGRLVEIDPDKIKDLNDSQRKVVKKALSSNGMFLIQGPPGTGKTQVIAKITELLVEQGKKVLIASENNKAVDNAFSRLSKIPNIRPVRLIHDKSKRKDNQYSPENLVVNFYNNISHNLRDEINRYENHERYIEQVTESLADLRIRLNRINELKKNTKKTENRISEIINEINDLYHRIDEYDDNNQKIDEDIEKINIRIEQLDEFKGEEFEQITSLLGDRFGLKSNSEDFRRLLQKLANMEASDLTEQYDLYEEHKRLIELFAEKDRIPPDDPKGLILKNGEIRAYEESKEGISRKQLEMFILIRDNVPEIAELNKFRLELKNEYEKTKSRLNRAIKNSELMKVDSIDIQSEIKELRHEENLLKTEEKYQELEKEIDEFKDIRNKVMQNLKMTSCPKDLESSLDQIENEIRRANHRYSGIDEQIRTRLDTYRRIAKYIEDPEIAESDSDRYIDALFKNVNIIGMTCTSSNRITKNDEYSMNLREQNIDTVIIDEVSKVSFVELIQPILMGKTVILVGDHKQLPPMYTELSEEEIKSYDDPRITKENEERFKKLYETSFFNELFQRSPQNVKETLMIQYRMHEDIMDIDNVFYNNKLEFGGNPRDKEHFLTIKGANGRNIIEPDIHVIFVDTHGKEDRESGSYSFSNEREALVISTLLKSINESCILDGNGNRLKSGKYGAEDTRLSVGVISAYSDQTRLIKKKVKGYRFDSFRKDADERFMVKSIDDFQGDERDIILMSLVKSEKPKGFISIYNRINVAVSRARRLLIIVGNASNLEKIRVDIDGMKRYVYKDMISKIKRNNGFIKDTDVLGVE